MDDKNEREKLMEELKRINREKFEKFYETICESFDDFLERKSLVKDDWKMKCPYKYGDNHYCVKSSGDVFSDSWHDIEADYSYFSQGNIFTTEQAAELEAKRRNLLTRFRAFRDECNNGWKPDFNDDEEKYYLYYSILEECIDVGWIVLGCSFNIFGYFKNQEDAERAIELFGDEIKEMFIDCEEE
jgi:hypothetical protein